MVRPGASWLGGLAQSLFATIFPSDCRLCGCFLANISPLPVCPECIGAIAPMAGNFCEICGERLPAAAIEPACALCRQSKPPYSRALAYGSYDSELRELIHLLKYDNVLPAAKILGRMLAQVVFAMQSGFSRDPVLVVPVPLHSAKMRSRGFNQSELIARQALKVASRDRFKIESHLLKRRRITKSQIGLTQNQRKENLRGAFVLAKTASVRGREILLVDDVFTTGTTAAECTRVLLRAGASKVWVATAARTLKVNIPGFESGVHPLESFAA